MKKIFLVLAAAVLSTSAYAGAAFFKYERVTGMTKQCVYDHLGSEYTITIPATRICPLRIEV